MHNYFLINGLDTRKPIFNIEFEYHREILKTYGIDTIEDALSRSKSLFELGCEAVKLIDISELTKEQLKSPNKRRAPLLPIWEYVSTHYDNKDFMQIETPLEKIERISYRYSLEDARKPIKRQIMRLLIHDNNPTSLYFIELLQTTREDYQLRQNIKHLHQDTQKDDIPINVLEKFEIELLSYSDEGLLNFQERLERDINSDSISEHEEQELSNQYSFVYKELVKRNLVEDFPF